MLQVDEYLHKNQEAPEGQEQEAGQGSPNQSGKYELFYLYYIVHKFVFLLIRHNISVKCCYLV